MRDIPDERERVYCEGERGEREREEREGEREWGGGKKKEEVLYGAVEKREM